MPKVIKVDPRSPVLWVRVSGLDKWRSVLLLEGAPVTPTNPEPEEWLTRSIDASAERQVRVVRLAVDAARTRLLAARLRVVGTFAPHNTGPITVEFFQPKQAVNGSLPAPVETVSLPWSDDLDTDETLVLEATQ